VETLGRYEVLGELGRGAISVVYDARDLLTDGRVALKLIEPSLWAPSTSPAERLRFLTEAMPDWRLKHSNIVTVYDAGDADGRLYVAMERLEGRSLRRMLDESTAPDVPRSLRMAAELASGLAHAHAHGVVHRHLQPSNILVLTDGRSKITDFGMASLRDAAAGASPNHVACLSYMSPEEIRCDPVIDGRADIYSLGVVLYEMLTGKAPFDGSTPTEIMRNVLEAEPPLPSEANPSVPPAVDLLVWSMLAKNPDDRAPNADGLVRHLLGLSDEIDGALAALDSEDGGPVDTRSTVGGRASDDRRLALIPHPGMLRRAKPGLPRYAWTALILAAAGSAFLLQWRHYPEPPEARGAAPRDVPGSLLASEPWVPEAPRLTASVPERSEPPVASEALVRDESPPAASAPEPKKRTTKAPAAKPSGSPRPARKVRQPVAALAAAAPSPAKTATLVFDVSPWGEIYVDGKPHGTTPPVKTLSLPPGTHRIEVRNSARLPYLGSATLQAGDVRRIRHDFE
jgi:serine/threonine-protein kinase